MCTFIRTELATPTLSLLLLLAFFRLCFSQPGRDFDFWPKKKNFRSRQRRNGKEEFLEREQTAEEVAADAGMTCKEYRDVMAAGLCARQKMVLNNLPLVASLAHKYRSMYTSGCLQARERGGGLEQAVVGGGGGVGGAMFHVVF